MQAGDLNPISKNCSTLELGKTMKNVVIGIRIDCYSFRYFVFKAVVKYKGELAFLLILVVRIPRM